MFCSDCRRKAREGTWDWACTRKGCSVREMIELLERRRRAGKVSPDDPAVLMAVTDHGIFVLRDDGVNRTTETIGPSEMEKDPWEVNHEDAYH